MAVRDRTLAAIALSLGLAAGGGPTVLAADADLSATGGVDLRDEAAIRKGEQQFNGLCAGYCHGTGGTAKRGPALRNRPELDEATLHYVIVNGRRRSGNPMPGWKGLLREEQIWQIIAYIVSLRDAPPLDKH